MSKVTEAWLSNPNSIKGIFVIVNVSKLVGGTWTNSYLYLSNVAYATLDSYINYIPIITGGLQISESMSLDNAISMSFGDIAVQNLNGEYDSWLDYNEYVWSNKSVNVYVGDPSWLSTVSSFNTDFELVFSGIVDDIDSSSREQLNIKIRDKLERLNTTLTENKLGTYGTWANGQNNKDTIRPIVFGEVFNISPLLIDPATLEYMYNDVNIGTIVTSTTSGTNILTCVSTVGFKLNNPIVFTSTINAISSSTVYYIKSISSSTTFTISATAGGATLVLGAATGAMLAQTTFTNTERVIEIRDNGVPIYNSTNTSNVAINLAAGTFKLLKASVGTITASIQGVTTNVNLTTGAITSNYKNTLTNIICTICTQYGSAVNRLTTSELDLANNLSAFDSANSIPVGYYVSERDNVLNVCQAILSSIGAQLYMTRQGKLRILKLGIPTTDSIVAITDRDIIYHSLSISNKVPVLAANKLGYCKNWTVQNDLLTNIPAAHKDLMSQEWLTSTNIDNTIKSTYGLDADPVQKDTSLIVSTNADYEAARLTTYFKNPKTVYKFTGTARLFVLKLGQSVTLTHNRFNLSTTKTGQVISLIYDWISGTIDVEVII